MTHIYIVYNLNDEIHSLWYSESNAEKERLRLNNDPNEKWEYFIRCRTMRDSPSDATSEPKTTQKGTKDSVQ